MEPQIYDYVGKPITTGCRVAYPLRRGSKLWIQVVTVARIRYLNGNIVITGKTINGKRAWTHNINNCVVIDNNDYWHKTTTMVEGTETTTRR